MKIQQETPSDLSPSNLEIPTTVDDFSTMSTTVIVENDLFDDELHDQPNLLLSRSCTQKDVITKELEFEVSMFFLSKFKQSGFTIKKVFMPNLA